MTYTLEKYSIFTNFAKIYSYMSGSLLRLFLLPFSLLYGLITSARNFLYDKNFLRSVQFNLPVIAVGNLSTGGTGKTPHIEYLIRLLQHRHKTATLSRGYKRKSKGFLLADQGANAFEIGDEPMQFYSKYPDINVSVCEDRIIGIPRLLDQRPETEVILLDDAFQHRAVRAGINILITDYHRPYFRDLLLPAGRLRERRQSAKRADVIIVSKCPASITAEEQQAIIRRIRPRQGQQVFFTGIEYAGLRSFYSSGDTMPGKQTDVLMVCGIAYPEPMIRHLEQISRSVRLLSFPDHHYFSLSDLEAIRSAFDALPSSNKTIVTTEKDAVRLDLHREWLQAAGIPVFIQPITVYFMNDASSIFDNYILRYIEEQIMEEEAGIP